ncbi:hypothetical protein [Spongiimicrobium sp. 3-5]|uniref:hypothetical protein n=1 Tax=Spongiimicrobium sp. 3-5 TaxID=3332596 RepID=UPI00397FF664
MKKTLLQVLLLVFVLACDSSDPSSENNEVGLPNQEENVEDEPDNPDDEPELVSEDFVVLIPNGYPISSFELDDGKSLILYTNITDTVFISQLNNEGEIEWTKEHTITGTYSYGLTFVLNNSIYLYSSNSGLNKYVFNFSGDLMSSKLVSNETDYSIFKMGNFIYAPTLDIDNRRQVWYKKYTIEGDFVDELKFDVDYMIFPQDIIVKNDKIYVFEKSDFQPDPDFYENAFCEIYDLDGNLIDTINTEILGTKTKHSNLVLANGNVLMSVYDPEVKNIELRLFSPEAAFIDSWTYEAINNTLSHVILKDDKIGLAGGRERVTNTSNPKLSQLTILSPDLEKLYTKNLGSYDYGEFFFDFVESDEFYYVLGRSAGRDGDFESLNEAEETNLFFYRLNK